MKLRGLFATIVGMLPIVGGLFAHLEILPGTVYSKYAIPLDYKPSRAFFPRYGETEPPISQLMDWFTEYAESYQAILAEMTMHKEALSSIPLEFHSSQLPQPAWQGVPIASFDGAALYTIIQHFRPKRYFEIGSGITTCFAYKAIQDAGLITKILSIDPDPRAEIDAICTEVIRDGLETCDLSIFDELESGDILFLDGSHRSFMNSDVTVFFIDLLPRIKPGVIIHIHDILLPWDYPDSFKYWYWNEQYMLAVYLMNACHRIIPLFPAAFVCRSPLFSDWFKTPLIDLGVANDSWRGGSSMWFMHK